MGFVAGNGPTCLPTGVGALAEGHPRGQAERALTGLRGRPCLHCASTIARAEPRPGRVRLSRMRLRVF
jgi:hypothetical protein